MVFFFIIIILMIGYQKIELQWLYSIINPEMFFFFFFFYRRSFASLTEVIRGYSQVELSMELS